MFFSRDYRCLIVYLGKSFDDVFYRGFVRVVFDGYCFFFQVGPDILDAFFETDVVPDFIFAILAVHFRTGPEDYGLDVFRECDGGQQE